MKRMTRERHRSEGEEGSGFRVEVESEDEVGKKSGRSGRGGKVSTLREELRLR